MQSSSFMKSSSPPAVREQECVSILSESQSARPGGAPEGASSSGPAQRNSAMSPLCRRWRALGARRPSTVHQPHCVVECRPDWLIEAVRALFGLPDERVLPQPSPADAREVPISAAPPPPLSAARADRPRRRSKGAVAADAAFR